MTALQHLGGCHCGALRWTFTSEHALDAFTPRACDCDFCTRHRAAWVSDARGALQLHGAGNARHYRQGSAQADFLFCAACGVLVAVTCQGLDGRLRSAINRNSFDQRHLLGAEAIASPQQLAADAKLARWSQLWTPTALG
ncbi:GFA family protein [Lysobacter solisilvae (ex Woo and Kim 2020)]|uniref:Aldehyde-activating protein n=1 Tax=Agrilutibacter terrestris TaxID=2865112 RepID=A0A7H0FVJ0_9GAMM|nr:aldehyde-activating protein [Lysobacter terrestris]QNP40056.1 aldehyde-activating protein [Lysobacter terrestris]